MLVNSHVANPFAISATTINNYSIGQHISITFNVTASASVLNKSLYFNPALFTNSFAILTTVPTSGWRYDVPGSLPATGVMEMLNCGTGYLTEQNYYVEITFNSNTDFDIEFRFFLTDDVDSFMNCTSLANIDRFTKDSANNPTILNNSFADVYTNDKKGVFHIGADDGVSYEYTNYSTTWAARWYNSGLYNGSPEFTNFNYVLSRDSVAVSNFSIWENTTLTAQIDYTGTPADKVQVFLIRLDDTNAGQNYLDDLTLSGALVNAGVPGSIASGISGVVYATSTCSALTNTSGNTYVFSHELQAGYFVNGGQYRIVITFRDDINFLTNSFISGTVIVADAPPEGCKPTITGQVITYNTNSSGNYIKTSVCDRVKCQIDVSRTDFLSCLTTLGYPGNYDTYFTKYVVRVTDSTGATVASATSNFSTILSTQLSNDTIGSNERYCYSFRIPDNWGGGEYTVQHEVYFTYSIATTYVDKLVFRQKICVRDFDNVLPSGDQLMTGATLTDTLGNPINNICDTDEFCVQFEKIATAFSYNILGILNSSITGKQEEEGYSGYLDTLVNDYISSVDTGFSANLGNVCIDTDEISAGIEYSICAIAKPTIVVVIPVTSKTNLTFPDFENINVFDAGSIDSLGSPVGTNPDTYHTYTIYEKGVPANVIAVVEGFSLDPVTVSSAPGYETAFTGTGSSIFINKYQAGLARGEIDGLAPHFTGTPIEWTVSHQIDYGASPPSSSTVDIPIRHRLTFDDSFYDTGGGAPYILQQPPIGGPALVQAPAISDGSGWRIVPFDGLTYWAITQYNIGGVVSGGTLANYQPNGGAQFASLNLANEFPTLGFSYGQPIAPFVNGTDYRNDYLISTWTDVDLRQIDTYIFDGTGYIVIFEVLQTVRV